MTIFTPHSQLKFDIEIDNEFSNAAVFIGDGENTKIISLEELIAFLPDGILDYIPEGI